MADILGWLRNRWTAPPLSSLSPFLFSNKTVIVTGASNGLGLEAARHYAQLGASRIILAVRSQTKGDAAKASILTSLEESKPDKAGLPPQIDVWLVDLASFASVTAFGPKVREELERVDVAVLNAG